MNRDRFLLIKKFLCFNETTQNEPDDPLYKIRPLYDFILKACKDNWISEEKLSLDESMISFNGKHSGTVFMPRKPIKNGFKIYVLADYGSYVINFVPSFCFGESTTVRNIVFALVQDYANKGYHLFMDR